MSSIAGTKTLDKIEMDLRGMDGDELTIVIDVYDNSLSHKWLQALKHLLMGGYHLEKNYCFFGFVDHARNGRYILDQINRSIDHINRHVPNYHIDDWFSWDSVMTDEPIDGRKHGRNIRQDRFNWLHRYFEDLQGVSGAMSPHWQQADTETKWHIRQLNLLCHEFESWALSYRKQIEAPEWQRPSQLMCWLQAPRFLLDEKDLELFGIDTINRPLGGVFVGVNKAVGKHHWEVFSDEGRDSRIDELISTSMRGQTEAAGDFDIEWANDPGQHKWQQILLQDFRQWLLQNGFDPEDKSLTIGHPQVAQVDLQRSFGTVQYQTIWQILAEHLDVYRVRLDGVQAVYDYCWSDMDYPQQQIKAMSRQERS